MIYGVEDFGRVIPPVAATGGVHFDGAIQGGAGAYLDIPALAATNNGLYSFSMWIKGLCTSANNSGVLMVHDPGNNYDPSFSITSAGHLDFLFQPSGELHTRILSSLLTSAAWHHLLWSADLNHAAGARVFALYVDRNLISYSTTFGVGNYYQVADLGAAISNVTNTKEFIFGDDGFSDGPVFDAAYVWIAPGVSLLSGSTIPSGTLDLFIDAGGHPTDPTGWPTSAVQFYGDAASFTTNHGTGGAATLTGVLTDVAGPT